VEERARTSEEGRPSASRTLTDVTGTYGNFVLEGEVDSLEQFEKGHDSTGMAVDWRKLYARFSEYVISGRREIFKIVPEK
jgi:hypothetical protein